MKNTQKSMQSRISRGFKKLNVLVHANYMIYASGN